MKKYVKSFIFVMILFVGLFVNINGVKADGGYCSVDANIQEGYACDYSTGGTHGSADFTLFFVKHSSGYCAEISKMQLSIDSGGTDLPLLNWLPLVSSDDPSYGEERRKVTTFELGDEIENSINNKSCPRIKAVITTNGFGSTGVKNLIMTTPGLGIIDDIRCGFSANIAYLDSFCLISDGSNFRKVSNSEIQQTIEDAQDNRDGANLEKIKWWAEDNGYDNVDSLGDDCSIISNSLKDILSSAFWIICIAGIILVVVMTAIGFIKAITGSDDEKFRDAIKNLFTRIIVIIILLLLPALLTFIINIINSNITGTVSIGEDGNVFCDISK